MQKVMGNGFSAMFASGHGQIDRRFSGIASRWGIQRGMAMRVVHSWLGKVTLLVVVVHLGLAMAWLGCLSNDARHGDVISGQDLSSPGRLHPARQAGKWGYINSAGKMCIEPVFKDACEFREGTAAVMAGGKWGFIDRTGKVIISPSFDLVGRFSEGLAPVKVGVRQDQVQSQAGSWGYVDKQGNMVIEPRFAEAMEFHEGLALVRSDGGHGLIDRAGRWVVRGPLLTNSRGFYEGLLPVLMRAGYGYMDHSGRWIIGPQYALAFDFSEGLACIRTKVQEDGKSSYKEGYIDRSGAVVISARFDAATYFSEGLAAVNIGGRRETPPGWIINGGKWGYIDKSGRMIIEPRFDIAWPFTGGVAAVMLGQEEGWKWGFIDRRGMWVVPPHLTEVYQVFDDGVASVQFGGSDCFIQVRTGCVIFRSPSGSYRRLSQP